MTEEIGILGAKNKRCKDSCSNDEDLLLFFILITMIFCNEELFNVKKDCLLLFLVIMALLLGNCF